MTDSEKYGTGYKKPPRETRFKPGQSGNPKGRPPGGKNLSTIVRDTVNETVVVNENGKRKTISKLEASVKQLVNKAAAGDHKSIQQIINLCRILEEAEDSKMLPHHRMEEADQIVLATLMKRLSKQEKDNE